MAKNLFDDIFDLNRDGVTSALELSIAGMAMHMLSDKEPKQYEEDELDEDMEDYLTEEDFEDEDSVDYHSVRQAILDAGFDRADVELLDDEEIQTALDDAALDIEEACDMEPDDLREALLYDLNAGLSHEGQLKQNLIDCGLDALELAEMDEEERNEALEEAGLEAWDYEGFDFGG